MSQLNVGTLRPSEAFTVPLQSIATRDSINHSVGSIIYNTDSNVAQVLTANDGWLNLGKGKIVASGGSVSSPGNGWKYHVYTDTSSPSTFTITTSGFQAYAEVLVVAGGGGGGGSHSGGGGGGAGGILWQPQWFAEPGTYTVKVGAGGEAGPPGSYNTAGNYYTGQGDGTFFHGRRGGDSYITSDTDAQVKFIAIGGGGGMESFYTNNEQRTKSPTNFWGQPDGHEEKNGGNGGGSGDHYTGVQSWVTHNLGGRTIQGNFGGYGYGNSGGSRYANGPGPHNGPFARKNDGNYPSGTGGSDGGFVPRNFGMNGHGPDSNHAQPHEGAGGGGCGGYELGRMGSDTDYGNNINWPATVRSWNKNAPGSGGPGRYFPGFEYWGTTQINATTGTRGWFGGGGDGGQYYYTTNGSRGANNKGGGGGQGSHWDPSYNQAAGNGLVNTGGGGGGGSSNNNGGGNQGGTKAGAGGSGIVIIRYKE